MKRGIVYTLTYILITAISAVSTVFLSAFLGTSSDVPGGSNDSIGSVYETTAGEKVLNNFMTMGTTEVNLELELYETGAVVKAVSDNENESEILNKIKISFIGNINIADFDNIKLDGSINVKIGETNINLDLSFIDGVLYVSNETLNIKLEAVSVSKIMDLLPLFELDLDIGIDLSALDINEIMSNFGNMAEVVREDGDIELTLELFEGISVQFITDSEYNVKNIIADEIQIANYVINLNAGLSKTEIEIVSPETNSQNEYVDVTKTLNVVDSIKEIMTNEKLHLDISAVLGEGSSAISIIGDVDVDYSDQINVYADLDINLQGTTHKLALGYINDNIYITLNDLSFLVDEETIVDVVDLIKSYLNISEVEQNVLLAIAQVIPGFDLEDILNGDFSKIDIDNLLEFSKGEDNVIKITVFGEAIGINEDISLTIRLDEDDQFKDLTISDINVLDTTLDICVAYTSNVNIPELNDEGYYNLRSLPHFANALIKTIENISTNQKCGFGIDGGIKVSEIDIELSGNMLIDFTNKDNVSIYLNLDVEILNKTFDIRMYIVDCYIYLSIDDIKLTCSINDISDVIDVISNYLDNSDVVVNTLESVNMVAEFGNIITELMNGNLSAIPQDLITFVNLTQENFAIGISKDLVGSVEDIVINIEYANIVDGISVEDIELDGFELGLDLELTDDIQIPTIVVSEYTSLEHLDRLVSAILNTIHDVEVNDSIAMNIELNTKFNDVELLITGTVAYKEGTIFVTVSTTYFDRLISVQLYLVDETIYLELDGLKVKTTIDGIKDIVSLFETEVEGEVLGTTLSLIDLASLDLSTLDLNVIKEISIGETNSSLVLGGTYIGLNQDIRIDIGYSDTLTTLNISTISFKDIEISANIQIASYAITPVVDSEYNDISYLYRVIESVLNTVDYIKENKEIAFTINTNIMSKYAVRGTVYANFSNVEDINEDYQNLVAYISLNVDLDQTYSVTIRLDSGYLFVEFNGLYIKSSISSLVDVVDVLKDILPTDLDNVLADVMNNQYLAFIGDIIDGDYSKVTLGLLKKITMSSSATYITLDKSIFGLDRDFTISITYDDKIKSINVLNVYTENKSSNINLALNYVFTPSALNVKKYFDISGISRLIDAGLNTVEDIKTENKITLKLNNLVLVINNTSVEISGIISVDFSDIFEVNDNGEDIVNIKNLIAYADISIKTKDLQTNTYDEYIHNITINYVDQYIYVTYNTLNVCVGIDSIDSIVDLVKQFEDLSNKVNGNSNTKSSDISLDIDIVEVLKNIFPNINYDALINLDINSWNMKIIKYLNISDNNLNIILSKEVLGTANDIELEISYSDAIDSISLEGLSVSGINIRCNIDIDYQFDIPSVDQTKYSNIDYLADAISSVLYTAEDVVENENIAFGFDTELTYTSFDTNESKIITKETITKVKLLETSHARFDWANAYDYVEKTVDGSTVTEKKFNIEKLKIYARFDASVDTITYSYTNGERDESTYNCQNELHLIEITYIDNVVYIHFDKMYMKISGESIGNVIDQICNLVGLDVSVDSFDNLLGMISNGLDMSMLSGIRVEMLKSISVTDSKASIICDLSSFGIDGLETLDLDINYSTTGLTNLTIKNLNIANIAIDAVDISLTEFTPIEMVDSTGYMNLDGIEGLLDALVNTLEFKDFEIDGSVKLQLNILNINFDIPVNMKLKLVDTGFEAKVVVGPIPVITGVNDDAPYIAGNTVDGIYPGKNRILTMYIKDNMVYIHRIEDIPVFLANDRVYEKRTKVHIDTFMSDPLYYLLEYGMGFSSTVMDAIYSSLEHERTTPMDYSNIITGFSATDNCYSLTLNLAELADNNQLDTFTVNITTTSFNSKNVVSVIALDVFMPVADSVEITLKSDNLTFVNMGEIIDFNSDLYPYVTEHIGDREGAEYDAYNGEWTLSSQRKFTITFVTNCDQVANSIEGIAGSKITLPTLNAYYVDSDTCRTYYEFAGWFTTVNYDTEYTENVMPRKSVTLYAKWIKHVENYITIDFVENGGEEKTPLRVLENSKLSLPTYFDLLVIESEESIQTLQFEGWYIDEELTTQFVSEYAPTKDLILYAKWEVLDVAETHSLNVYDNGEKIAVKRLFEGSTISLGGSTKFNDSTKYYLDANYVEEFTDMIMPDYDLDLHIRNIYTITISYKLMNPFRNAENIVISAYQGESFTLPSQESSYYDDGTETERIVYTFNGWKVNGESKSVEIIPNENANIVADWTETKLAYYTVSFNVSWVKPGSWQDNNSNVLGKITKVSDATAPTSFKVLEGTVINPSEYQALCIYKYTGAWVTKTYEFDVAYWSDSASGQLYYNNGVFKNDSYTEVTSYTVTDDVVLYAVWKMCKDY